jgi:hypothetical protein
VIILDTAEICDVNGKILVKVTDRSYHVLRGNPGIMTKRQRPYQSESEAGDDAVTERVKRLAIESGAGSPLLLPYRDGSTLVSDVTQPHAQPVHGHKMGDEEDFETIYRDQALRLRELHFERVQRINLEKQFEKQNNSSN